jgi:hypothetical protein
VDRFFCFAQAGIPEAFLAQRLKTTRQLCRAGVFNTADFRRFV